MPTYFQRPENALKRATEFIDVGKDQRALDALYDVIKSKKHRTWQKIHEPIMEKYLELCVDLRKSHIAKEGLYQYKNICQQVNINSLVDVVRKYIALAEERTEAARQESHQTVLDIDDLDLPDSPESLLLKAVSGEDTHDRTDRSILTPWVKFLWESYRQCLDLLRNNSRIERLYQDIAQQAFKFCLKYSRKTEFRKLCDNLRTHLGHVHKHQHQQTAINLNNQDSQGMHLETRLVQLDSAINMELWQEAFKAVEDIHGFITLSKKQPKPALMANYLQKLGLVFAKSGKYLFHASTLHRLFVLSREQRRNMSQDELQRMANRVVCSTLAAPIPVSRNPVDNLLATDDSGLEKRRRLASLLMLQSPPSRQSLVSDVARNGALQCAAPELQDLYRYLEVEFNPLHLCSAVKPIMLYIASNDDLSMYITQLEDIIIMRVLKQVSQVYQTVEFKRFASLVPFADKFRLEGLIVSAAKSMELQVRIDHRHCMLLFGTDLGLSQQEETVEGPTIQCMPSEQIRKQLTVLGQVLSRAVTKVAPVHTDEDETLKANILNSYRLTARKEHARILQRRHVIEERKEQLENMVDMRDRRTQEQAEETRRQCHDAEMARLAHEVEERKKQQQLHELEEIKRKHARERFEEIRKTPQGLKMLQNIDEAEMVHLDVDEIMTMQVEQLEKDKKELQERLRGQEKKVDYLARAKRLEEIPFLMREFEEQKKLSEEFWIESEMKRVEQLKLEREEAVKTKVRLFKMVDDTDIFLSNLKKMRKSEYEEKLKEFENLLLLERKHRLHERRLKRREERHIKWIHEQEEAAQRACDEQLKREHEERERQEQEEREQLEREYAEKLAKLEAQAEKQRQREREVEERQQEREKMSEATRQADNIRRDNGPRQDLLWRSRNVDRDECFSHSQQIRGDNSIQDERSGAPKNDLHGERHEFNNWRNRSARDVDDWRPRPARDGDSFPQRRFESSWRRDVGRDSDGGAAQCGLRSGERIESTDVDVRGSRSDRDKDYRYDKETVFQRDSDRESRCVDETGSKSHVKRSASRDEADRLTCEDDLVSKDNDARDTIDFHRGVRHDNSSSRQHNDKFARSGDDRGYRDDDDRGYGRIGEQGFRREDNRDYRRGDDRVYGSFEDSGFRRHDDSDLRCDDDRRYKDEEGRKFTRGECTVGFRNETENSVGHSRDMRDGRQYSAKGFSREYSSGGRHDDSGQQSLRNDDTFGDRWKEFPRRQGWQGPLRDQDSSGSWHKDPPTVNRDAKWSHGSSRNFGNERSGGAFRDSNYGFRDDQRSSSRDERQMIGDDERRRMPLRHDHQLGRCDNRPSLADKECKAAYRDDDDEPRSSGVDNDKDAAEKFVRNEQRVVRQTFDDSEPNEDEGGWTTVHY